jgi:deazaflavin-dependent oxidoreductase (nitroreductase family)
MANNWNQQIIEEFRANGGKVGGPFAGGTLLLLTTTGAKSGLQRITPLVYLPDNGRYVIFASNAGAPTHPDWYHNLVAHPEATIEVGTEKFEVTVRVATGAERDQLAARVPVLAEHQAKTTREIPVVVLERR